MAIIITDECINCGACEAECPNTAIYEGASDWSMSEGTSVLGNHKLNGGEKVDASTLQTPLNDDIYYIVFDKCTECIGFFDEPQCAAVCPVDCCIVDIEFQESEEDLLLKKSILHPL